jgi:hypothetical protein
MERSAYPQDLDGLCPRFGIGRDDGDPLVAGIVQSTTFCRDGVESLSLRSAWPSRGEYR